MDHLNPFAPLYAKCNTGDPAHKYRDLPAFPEIIDVEATSLCNMRCNFCPTGLQALDRPSSFMKWKTWTQIVRECARHGTALRIIGWGEPFLHPKLLDMIAYATEDGLLTHINTNGTKLTPSYAYELIAAGLTSIKFSFQGVNAKTYLAMRNTDFFEGVLEAIEIMRNARGKKALPYLAASTSTTTETQEEIEAFCARLEPLVDELTIGQTIFGFIDKSKVPLRQRMQIERLMKEESATKRHPDPCPEVYNKLSIHWDGSVAICCNAYGTEGTFGNIHEDTIKELWRHPALEAYRTRLARKDYDAPLCRDCWDYADLTKGTA